MQPSRTGTPVLQIWTPSPSKRSPSLRVNCRATASWSTCSTLTTKRPLSTRAGRQEALRPIETSASGGSSETEVKLLAVNPTGVSPCSVVTTVTPVVKQPKASRSARASAAGSSPSSKVCWRSIPIYLAVAGPCGKPALASGAATVELQSERAPPEGLAQSPEHQRQGPGAIGSAQRPFHDGERRVDRCLGDADQHPLGHPDQVARRA